MSAAGGSVQAASEPLLVQFGEIGISQHWLVTPVATMPLAGTQIQVADMSRQERVMPTWAIVLTVLGALFFLLGLLFLLVRETRVTGFMQITVWNGDVVYQSLEPAQFDPVAQFYELQNRANFARGIIARA
jgi:hypothetical protein